MPLSFYKFSITWIVGVWITSSMSLRVSYNFFLSGSPCFLWNKPFWSCSLVGTQIRLFSLVDVNGAFQWPRALYLCHGVVSCVAFLTVSSLWVSLRSGSIFSTPYTTYSFTLGWHGWKKDNYVPATVHFWDFGGAWSWFMENISWAVQVVVNQPRLAC